MSHYHQPGVGLTIPAIIGQDEAFTGVFRRIPSLGLRLTQPPAPFPLSKTKPCHQPEAGNSRLILPPIRFSTVTTSLRNVQGTNNPQPENRTVVSRPISNPAAGLDTLVFPRVDHDGCFAGFNHQFSPCSLRCSSAGCLSPSSQAYTHRALSSCRPTPAPPTTIRTILPTKWAKRSMWNGAPTFPAWML